MVKVLVQRPLAVKDPTMPTNSQDSSLNIYRQRSNYQYVAAMEFPANITVHRIDITQVDFSRYFLPRYLPTSILSRRRVRLFVLDSSSSIIKPRHGDAEKIHPESVLTTVPASLHTTRRKDTKMSFGCYGPK